MPRKCIFRCKGDYPLFTIPKDDSAIRQKWLDFIFGNNPPTKKICYICSRHFTDDSFLNKSQFDSGLIGRLSLKEDAFPSLTNTSMAYEKEAIRNFNAALEQDRLIICHSPTTDNDRTSNMSIPVKLIRSDGSNCCVSEKNVLPNIENPDIIKKTADHLQETVRYVVDEKQLLQLFSSQCPTCESKVNMEKVVCGVVLTVNLQCPQCGYSKEWKNLDSTNIPAADDTQQMEHTETTIETVSDNVPELVYCVGEENDQTDLSDVSGEPGDMDSGEDRDPENKVLDDEEQQAESDDEIDDDNFVPPRNTELCTDCGTFFKKNKPHTCEHIIKPLSCNACGKRFVNELSLKHHTKIHDASYDFLCKCCHMKFKTKAAKTAHEQNHLTEEKPFKCIDCSEMFATYNERTIHMKIHRGPEELKCQFCGLEFSRIEHLRRHLIVHTGEKPYKCVVCERGFNQAGNLKSHMRLHTGEKPFKCQHCDQGFHHNVSLKSHIQRYHTPSSECQQKKTRKRKHDSDSDDYVDFWANDPESCLVESEQDTDDDAQLEELYRPKTYRKNTGRPKGRPKRNKVDGLLQAEDTQEQDSDMNTQISAKTPELLMQ